MYTPWIIALLYYLIIDTVTLLLPCFAMELSTAIQVTSIIVNFFYRFDVDLFGQILYFMITSSSKRNRTKKDYRGFPNSAFTLNEVHHPEPTIPAYL